MTVIAGRVETRGNNNDSAEGRDGVYTAVAGNEGAVRIYGPGWDGRALTGRIGAQTVSLARDPRTGTLVARVVTFDEESREQTLHEFDTGIAGAGASGTPAPAPAPAPSVFAGNIVAHLGVDRRVLINDGTGDRDLGGEAAAVAAFVLTDGAVNVPCPHDGRVRRAEDVADFGGSVVALGSDGLYLWRGGWQRVGELHPVIVVARNDRDEIWVREGARPDVMAGWRRAA